MPLLTAVKLDEIPVDKTTPAKGLALTGNFSLKETSSGQYVSVALPLYYFADKGSLENRVRQDVTTSELLPYVDYLYSNEAAKSAGLSLFIARWNVKPEWFTPEFMTAYKEGQLDANERLQYNINVVKLTRGFFKALGADEIDLNADVSGHVVGFKAAGTKNEPDRLQIQGFYPAPKPES